MGSIPGTSTCDCRPPICSYVTANPCGCMLTQPSINVCVRVCVCVLFLGGSSKPFVKDQYHRARSWTIQPQPVGRAAHWPRALADGRQVGPLLWVGSRRDERRRRGDCARARGRAGRGGARPRRRRGRPARKAPARALCTGGGGRGLAAAAAGAREAACGSGLTRAVIEIVVYTCTQLRN